MVERDLGSTFLLPESHLFKPAGDRVSAFGTELFESDFNGFFFVLGK